MKTRCPGLALGAQIGEADDVHAAKSDSESRPYKGWKTKNLPAF
jgi:hypothetical protein